MIDIPFNMRPGADGEPAAAPAAAGVPLASLGPLLWAYGERARVPLALKDIASGHYVWVNAAMASLLGRAPEAIVGHADSEWLSATQLATLRTAEQAAATQPAGVLSEHRVDFPAGRRDFSVLRMPLPEQDGSAPRYLAALWTDLGESRRREAQLKLVLEQLEQQQKANEQMRRETHDSGLRDLTTGLYNSPHFDDLLRREADLSAREHREFALVLVRLDPAVQPEADEPKARTGVLEALGRKLRSNTRAMDASCRLGEDRFAVLLSGVGLATAHSRMEGLRRQCATQIVACDGRDLGFTVSMGVSSFPHTAESREALLKAADDALAEAVRRGGNHVALASIRFEPPAAPGS